MQQKWQLYHHTHDYSCSETAIRHTKDKERKTSVWSSRVAPKNSLKTKLKLVEGHTHSYMFLATIKDKNDYTLLGV